MQPQSCANHKVGYGRLGPAVRSDVHLIIINSSASCGKDDHILRTPDRVEVFCFLLVISARFTAISICGFFLSQLLK